MVHLTFLQNTLHTTLCKLANDIVWPSSNAFMLSNPSCNSVRVQMSGLRLGIEEPSTYAQAKKGPYRCTRSSKTHMHSRIQLSLTRPSILIIISVFELLKMRRALGGLRYGCRCIKIRPRCRWCLTTWTCPKLRGRESFLCHCEVSLTNNLYHAT
jgi:hypothetical protein